MEISFPHLIENGQGETLLFTGIIQEPDGDKVIGETRVLPGGGPPLHVHWLQDEGFTVVSGKIAYQLQGGPVQYAEPGESVVFKKGVAHRFWNPGPELLQCQAWVKPACNFVFFLSAIFAAQRKSKTAKPDIWDAAFLLRRYRSEYAMTEIPFLVRTGVLPVVNLAGKLLGKYDHFKGAPEPFRK